VRAHFGGVGEAGASGVRTVRFGPKIPVLHAASRAISVRDNNKHRSCS
jgi:hypothetical protein